MVIGGHSPGGKRFRQRFEREETNQTSILQASALEFGTEFSHLPGRYNLNLTLKSRQFYENCATIVDG